MEMVDANLDVMTKNDCAAIKHLSAVGDRIIAGMAEIFERAGRPAIVQGFGPMFQIYFTRRESIDNYRDFCKFVDTDSYSKFANKLREFGVYVPVTNGLHAITCVAHSNKDVDKVLNSTEEVIKNL
jgi:glutamate-1-semialdehyde 2,1-aminomutase